MAEMNPKLAEYLGKVQEEVEQAQQRRADAAKAQKDREKETLLRELGLTEEVREYIDTDAASQNTFMRGRGVVYSEEIDGEKRYYTKKFMPIEITDEEFDQLKQAIARREETLENLKSAAQPGQGKAGAPAAARTVEPPREEYEVVSGVYQPQSRAASFLKTLAYATMILGTILSIIIGFQNTLEYTRSGVEMVRKFQFGVFLTSEVLFLLAGGLLLCQVELYDNINRLRATLESMTIRRKKQG